MHPQQDVSLAVIQLSVSAHVCSFHLQVFLLRTPDVAAADKPKLQQQILATIFSNGELVQCCCVPSLLLEPRCLHAQVAACKQQGWGPHTVENSLWLSAVVTWRCEWQLNKLSPSNTVPAPTHTCAAFISAAVLLCAGLAAFYEHLCTELGWTPDQAKLTEMQNKNAKQLEELEAKIKASSSMQHRFRFRAMPLHSVKQAGVPTAWPCCFE